MSMCKKIQCSSSEEESMMELQKQGIVTVLGSAETISLRRTLSADMSSKKWLSLYSSSEEEEEDDDENDERFKIWSTIQRDKEEQRNLAAPLPAKFDTWSSILFDKAKEETSNMETPYIHPSLVKRTKSSLSDKSLEICTESLGSETGSDHVLSSNSSTPSSDDEQEEFQQQVPKQNHVSVKKSIVPRSFPPPLPSLHMRSHRDGNGRLFLEAVHVASHNNKFSAQRSDGRLVLTFASDDEEEEEQEEEEEVGDLEEEFVGFDDEEYEEDENHDEVEEEKEPLLCSGVDNRLALMMNKAIGVVNRNPNWSERFNQVVNFEDDTSVSLEQHGLIAQSLPPRPRVARLIPSAAPVVGAASSLNAYDCYWGTNHTSKPSSFHEPLLSRHQQNNYLSFVKKHSNDGSKLIVYADVAWRTSSDDQTKLVVMRGKNGDYLVHNSKSCKDSRRSFLFWEPRCIAT